MIVIDGSAGEGGGQILRSALALSMVTGQPFRIENIRAGRAKPGLLRQHLTAVKAAAAISAADAEGAEIGAGRLTFCPGKVAPGHYHFAVGTAGSAGLVLQAVLPALLCAEGTTTLKLEGGTHNPFAPPFDFLERCYLPILRRMGAEVTARLQRPGFYPAGGGSFDVRTVGTDLLSTLDLRERGDLLRCEAKAVVANLPYSIAEREIAVLAERLALPEEALFARQETRAAGPGNVVTVELAHENLSELFAAFGERGVSAEQVAGDLSDAVSAYLEGGSAVGPYLADQLLLPFALAGGGSFTTGKPSLHFETNVSVIRQFLDIEISFVETSDGVFLVELGG